MGVLISLIKSEPKEKPVADIIIDLENTKPLPEESDLYNSAAAILTQTSEHLVTLKNYTGCGDYIRKAISQPSAESEKEAWDALCPAVAKLKEFYDFSISIEKVVLELVAFFGNGNLSDKLVKYQATAKKLCDILHFVSCFDEIKMSNPNVQNDFSYYRRSLSKLKIQPANLLVNDELANRMSLFYAYSAPMTKALTDSLINQRNQTTVSQLTTLIVAICHNAVPSVQDSIKDYCLRVIVISIILYDHVNTQGAFAKTSDIPIRASVKLIRSYGEEKEMTLINSLKYGTVHLNDETTPKSVKQLFADS